MELIKSFVQPLLGIIAIAISAQITFEFSISQINIPITGQTLGVILVAFYSKKYFGIVAVFLYLIFGGLGLPIFAEGSFGWDKFTSGSGGFLVGFLFAAIIIYFIKLNFKKEKLSVIALINIGGTIVILLFGITWLTYLFGFDKALEYGFFPFWIGALAKVGIGIFTMYLVGKLKIKENVSAL